MMHPLFLLVLFPVCVLGCCFRNYR
jgi:hypothetical protein